jgi:hypothetical protein
MRAAPSVLRRRADSTAGLLSFQRSGELAWAGRQMHCDPTKAEYDVPRSTPVLQSAGAAVSKGRTRQ